MEMSTQASIAPFDELPSMVQLSTTTVRPTISVNVAHMANTVHIAPPPVTGVIVEPLPLVSHLDSPAVNRDTESGIGFNISHPPTTAAISDSVPLVGRLDSPDVDNDAESSIDFRANILQRATACPDDAPTSATHLSVTDSVMTHDGSLNLIGVDLQVSHVEVPTPAEPISEPLLQDGEIMSESISEEEEPGANDCLPPASTDVLPTQAEEKPPVHIPATIHHMGLECSVTWLFNHTDAVKKVLDRCGLGRNERYIAKLSGIDCSEDLIVRNMGPAVYFFSALCIYPVQLTRVVERPIRAPNADSSRNIEIDVFNVLAGLARIITMKANSLVAELARLLNIERPSDFCLRFWGQDCMLRDTVGRFEAAATHSSYVLAFDSPPPDSRETAATATIHASNECYAAVYTLRR